MPHEIKLVYWTVIKFRCVCGRKRQVTVKYAPRPGSKVKCNCGAEFEITADYLVKITKKGD